jgi:hypothetical protein
MSHTSKFRVEQNRFDSLIREQTKILVQGYRFDFATIAGETYSTPMEPMEDDPTNESG